MEKRGIYQEGVFLSKRQARDPESLRRRDESLAIIDQRRDLLVDDFLSRIFIDEFIKTPQQGASAILEYFPVWRQELTDQIHASNTTKYDATDGAILQDIALVHVARRTRRVYEEYSRRFETAPVGSDAWDLKEEVSNWKLACESTARAIQIEREAAMISSLEEKRFKEHRAAPQIEVTKPETGGELRAREAQQVIQDGYILGFLEAYFDQDALADQHLGLSIMISEFPSWRERMRLYSTSVGPKGVKDALDDLSYGSVIDLAERRILYVDQNWKIMSDQEKQDVRERPYWARIKSYATAAQHKRVSGR